MQEQAASKQAPQSARLPRMGLGRKTTLLVFLSTSAVALALALACGYGIGRGESLTFDLQEDFRQFVAIVGLAGSGSLKNAEIRIDDERVWSSEHLHGGAPLAYLTINIPPGSRQLRIVRGSDGDGTLGIVQAGFTR